MIQSTYVSTHIFEDNGILDLDGVYNPSPQIFELQIYVATTAQNQDLTWYFPKFYRVGSYQLCDSSIYSDYSEDEPLIVQEGYLNHKAQHIGYFLNSLKDDEIKIAIQLEQVPSMAKLRSFTTFDTVQSPVFQNRTTSNGFSGQFSAFGASPPGGVGMVINSTALEGQWTELRSNQALFEDIELNLVSRSEGNIGIGLDALRIDTDLEFLLRCRGKRADQLAIAVPPESTIIARVKGHNIVTDPQSFNF